MDMIKIHHPMTDHNDYGTAGFIGGFIVAFSTARPIWTAELTMWFPTEFLIKFIATIILAAAGGVTGMIVKDVYKYAVKPYFAKKFNIKLRKEDRIDND